MESLPAGVCILRRGQSQVTHLRLIYSGFAKVYLKDDIGTETLRDFRGRGAAIGALGLLRGSLSNLDVETIEATTFILMTRDDFLDLVRAHTAFAQHFLTMLSENYVGRALTELERPRSMERRDGSLYLFNAPAAEISHRELQTIPATESVRAAASRMSDMRVGSLLIHDPSGEIVGIVTDRDLREKVVAKGLDYRQPVERIMSSPVHHVPAHTTCFEAMIEMMRRRCHHLALKRHGRIVGLISAHDIMVLQGTSPLSLLRDILDQERIEGLYPLAGKTLQVVRSLIGEGAKASHVNRVITLLNDHLLERMLDLLVGRLGQPPVPFCWLAMGSEGRKEQTFRTDQDNGLIYRDPESSSEAAQAEEYFKSFGRQAIEHLIACGYPACKGDIMASNPNWRQPLSIWRGNFEAWILHPRPKDILHATIFFDFRPCFGQVSLAADLRRDLLRLAGSQDVFLRLLAKDCLTAEPGLSFFRQFVTEKEGPHRNKLDLKTRGLTPLVDFARVMALKHGVGETNTLERLQMVVEAGGLTDELNQSANQAYEFLMHLRLTHQHKLIEAGLEPDNFLDPAALSDMDRRTLKDALTITTQIKNYLKEAFLLQTA